MDPFVLAAVLAAAVMHASWNAVVKVGLDRASAILFLALAQSTMALGLVPFFPTPSSAAWPWLIASGLLHTGYKLFLSRAYGHGDLAQVYPLARGTAPLLVALFGVLYLGEALGLVKAGAVLAIGAGVIVMSFRGGAELGRMPPRVLLYALGTAGFTTAYTLVDAVGARLSDSPSGFTLWMFVLDGTCMMAAALATRGRRAFIALGAAWRSGLIAGALSLGSYWIAIWAFTRAPVALVAALRETSVLFAMLIGILLLGERGGPWRWTAAALIAGGVVLMRL
ncbi:MAG: EamA family transporter [Rhodospirillales bacterium]|nr:EamA family transporter [Rhodospirillales bacterium]